MKLPLSSNRLGWSLLMAFFLTATAPLCLWAQTQGNRGPGGRGEGGQGRGPDARTRADQAVFHYLLEHHQEIRRMVNKTAQGVETLTESDNPEVTAKIQEHVTAMKARVEEGRGLRFWDELFAAIFRNYKKIEMKVEKTEKGVRVTETSTDPFGVLLIQAHAEVVSGFVARGFAESSKNHPVPDSGKSEPASDKKVSNTSELVFPIIPKYGGVLPRPQALEQPQAGAKVVFDITANTTATQVNPGLDRIARLLNLYGSSGLKSSDIQITAVLHGDATLAALTDDEFADRSGAERNPNLELIAALQQAGVKVLVCGQALNYKQFPDSAVSPTIPIASSAMNVVINHQAQGASYLPIR
jgi:intracellular sulfur oxidation DsrE/DsrF family protein